MRFIASIFAVSVALLFELNTVLADPVPADANMPPPPPSSANTMPSNVTPPRADGPHTSGMYPPLARRMDEQGIATVKFIITVGGTVADPIVVRSSGYPDLDDAALMAVRGWHYQPATMDGKPIAVRTEANIRFELTNPDPPVCHSFLCRLIHGS